MANMHRLAGLIWMAILVIAIQFVPNSALAHSGHEHGPGIAVSQQQAVQDHATHHAFRDVAKPVKLKTVLTAPGKSDPASRPSSGCVGGCCGSGLGCCGVAAIAGSANVLPQFDARTEIVAFDAGRPRSIEPEALARPPKTLA